MDLRNVRIRAIIERYLDSFSTALPSKYIVEDYFITKDQMISNENDEWYFTFATDGMVGLVTAECQFDVPDRDYPDRFRTEVDRQYICFVATDPFPNCICMPARKCQDTTVVYERTEESDVAELYAYLSDRLGRRLMTIDEEYILVLKKLLPPELMNNQ